MAQTNYGGQMAALQIAGTLSSAYAQQQMGRVRRKISETNERIGKFQAEMALKRGTEAEAKSRQRFKQLLGKQRAALAAQGIDIQSGSAQDIQKETQVMSELDALTIKSNTAREAFGFESQARVATTEGKFAEIQSRQETTQTLLTGGLRAFEYYQQRK